MAAAGAILGGRYVLDRRIGNGGYGQVWHATDNVLGRPVAVKLLHPRYADRAEALTRFQTEARLAGALSHKNIAQVYDYGQQAGTLASPNRGHRHRQGNGNGNSGGQGHSNGHGNGNGHGYGHGH